MSEDDKKTGEGNDPKGIAQALESRHKLDPKDPQSPPAPNIQIPELNEKMLSEAEDALGKYVTELFTTAFEDHMLQTDTLELMAPYGIIILPESNGSSISLKPSITPMKKELWLHVFGRKYPYLLGTGLSDVSDPVNAETLKETVPGYGIFVNQLSRCGFYMSRSDKRERLAIASCQHPYMFAMGIEPEYRAAVALAIKKKIGNRKFELPMSFSGESARDTILSRVPTIDYVAKTAEEYNIKDLRQVVGAINRLAEKYQNL